MVSEHMYEIRWVVKCKENLGKCLVTPDCQRSNRGTSFMHRCGHPYRAINITSSGCVVAQVSSRCSLLNSEAPSDVLGHRSRSMIYDHNLLYLYATLDHIDEKTKYAAGKKKRSSHIIGYYFQVHQKEDLFGSIRTEIELDAKM